MSKYKLVMFDMDGTLIKGRGIFVIAEKKGFHDELIRLIKDDTLEFYQRSIEIAKISKGYPVEDYLKIFREIPLQDHIETVIKEIKKKNIITAIATDSYKFLADDLKNRLGVDYVFANNIIIDENVLTGELEIHNKGLVEDFVSKNIYSICKSCVLEDLCKKLGVSFEETIAVGDGRVDIGMIKKSGLGIAFNAPEEVQKHADISIKDMRKILEYI